MVRLKVLKAFQGFALIKIAIHAINYAHYFFVHAKNITEKEEED